MFAAAKETAKTHTFVSPTKRAVCGTSVPDIRLNAIADPGYAEGRWLSPDWPGAGPLRGRGAKGKDLPGRLPHLDDWALIPV
jgi:hypothetical protein